MKGVLIGTDFLMDVDGSFKALETNTDVSFDVKTDLYFNSEELLSLITGSSINEMVFISKSHLNYQNPPKIDFTPDIAGQNTSNNKGSLKGYLETFCNENNVSFTYVEIDRNAITVPYVEDTPNKLIIRVSYDTTALIDDTYARDNWEFLKLMYDNDSNSIPKTFINDTVLNIDSLGTILRDNGSYPNYIIKKRFTPTDGSIWPKLMKIDSLIELDQIKLNLEVDEYIQEYIYNPNDLLDNRIKNYRSLDFIYGVDLDVMNFWIVESGNAFPIEVACDYDDTKNVQFWERPRFLSKVGNGQSREPVFTADETTVILKSDNTLVNVNQLTNGDVLTSFSIPSLPLDEQDFRPLDWYTSYDNFFSGNTITTTTVTNIVKTIDFIGLFNVIKTDDGLIFSDVSSVPILIKTNLPNTPNDYIIKFTNFGEIKVGNIVILYDIQTETLVEKNIIEKYITYEKSNAYTIDAEDIDLLVTLEQTTSTPRYGLVKHNSCSGCSFNCRSASAPSLACYDCYSGILAYFQTAQCCRCGGNYPGSCSPGYALDCRSSWWCPCYPTAANGYCTGTPNQGPAYDGPCPSPYQSGAQYGYQVACQFFGYCNQYKPPYGT